MAEKLDLREVNSLAVCLESLGTPAIKYVIKNKFVVFIKWKCKILSRIQIDIKYSHSNRMI